MRHIIIYTCVLCSLSTVVYSYAAGDQQRQYEKDRQRIIRPPVASVAVPVQRPQPAIQQSNSSQRERNQSQRSSQGDNSGQGQQSQPQVVSIDRLKLQSDSPAEYQFEPMRTLTIQDGESSRAEEELKTEQVEVAAEEQQEAGAEELVSTEHIDDEAGEEAVLAEEHVVHAQSGNALFRIIEENNQIIVTQVEAAPLPKGRRTVISD
jgi:hypothetical protein